MSSLANKMRAAREFKREINGLNLTMRRPTEREFGMLHRQDASHFDWSEKFVIGWDGVLESDLVPSGSSEEATFDDDVWSEFLADRHDLWSPVAEAIISEFNRYFDKWDERKKN